MRHAVFLIGPPGSGKSTFIKKYGIEHHSLSMDNLRQNNMGAMVDELGRWGYDQHQNKLIYQQFMELLKGRTERGETLFIEGIFPVPDNTFKFLKDQGYKVSVISFYGIDRLLLMERNNKRDIFKRCQEHVLIKIMERGENGHKEWLKALTKEQIEHYFQVYGSHPEQNKEDIDQFFHNLISPEYLPLSELGFNRVVHIGDIQGCNSVLVDAIKKNRIWEEGTLTLFVGDLLDRGRENGKVINTFLSEILPLMKKDRAFIIYGNHEAHLENWMLEQKVHAEEFNYNTLPDLLREGVTRKEVRQLFKYVIPFFRYELAGDKVTVTHAGLPRPLDGFGSYADSLGLLSLSQLSRGIGKWTDLVDKSWQEYIETFKELNLKQVHGHRNVDKVDALTYKNSINLEGRVEFGGKLMVVSHDFEGWKDLSLPNKYQHSISLKGDRETPEVKTESKVEAYKRSKLKNSI
jgi:predicted kinase